MRRLAHSAPLAGVMLFIAAYFHAAALYSTGTLRDPAHRGYEHLHNYWCDLYSTVTYTGEVNAGRPYAVMATLILTGALGSSSSPCRRCSVNARGWGVLCGWRGLPQWGWHR